MIYGLATDGKPYIWILELFNGLEVALFLLFDDAPGTIALNLLVASVAITLMTAAYPNPKRMICFCRNLTGESI
jgi:hypothetical protein